MNEFEARNPKFETNFKVSILIFIQIVRHVAAAKLAINTFINQLMENLSKDSQPVTTSINTASPSFPTDGKQHPRRFTLKVIAVVAGLAVVGGIFAAIYYSGILSSPKSNLTTTPAGVDLRARYLAYAKAVHAEDLAGMKAYTTQVAAERFEKRLERLTAVERAQTLEFLKVSVPASPEAAVFGAQVIEGVKGILRLETSNANSNPLSRVKNPRSYGTVFFVQEGGDWKIDRQYFVEYKDPTPLVAEDKTNPITFFWYAQFHANHTAQPSACEAESTWRGNCYRSWAILELSPSFCEKILSDDGFQAQERSRCFDDLAGLTGEVHLCDKVTPSGKESCFGQISDRDYLPETNIYRIDSDQDGLTDFQEAYFNTSLANGDTDGDGVSDDAEIKNDSNPLGQGRVGDHLLK